MIFMIAGGNHTLIHGCGVAAKGGVIDGCSAAYTTSVTFGDSFASRRSLGRCRASACKQQGISLASLRFRYITSSQLL
jgi:hypothetical protein